MVSSPLWSVLTGSSPHHVFKIHITGIVCTVVIGLAFSFRSAADFGARVLLIASTMPREQPVTSPMPVAPGPVSFLSLQTILSEQLSMKCACSFVLTTEVHVMDQRNVEQQ